MAKTISGGIVDDALVTPAMTFAGLGGAGVHGVHFSTVAEKILIPAVASPVVAGVVAMVATDLP